MLLIMCFSHLKTFSLRIWKWLKFFSRKVTVLNPKINDHTTHMLITKLCRGEKTCSGWTFHLKFPPESLVEKPFKLTKFPKFCQLWAKLKQTELPNLKLQAVKSLIFVPKKVLIPQFLPKCQLNKAVKRAKPKATLRVAIHSYHPNF